MQVRAETKYARISAFKVREVTREIQGMPALQALSIVRLIPKKAAKLIGKTLASAIANAENNNNLKTDKLFVYRAIAGEGPTFKRMHARARGSGSRINKRTAHIQIVLTDTPDVRPEKKTVKGSGKSKKDIKPTEPVVTAPAEKTSEPTVTESNK